MSAAQVIAPTYGRGAWNAKGKGGTLSSDGYSPGPYYRLATGTSALVGLVGARAVQAGAAVSLDDYAVHRAVVAVQKQLNLAGAALALDGVFGGRTHDELCEWQAAHELTADGVLGPKSARALWRPVLGKAARAIDPSHADTVERIAAGHVGVESQWDCAAVGVETPDDVGLGQVNGPAHPDLDLDDRLDPAHALDYVVRLVDDNLRAMSWNVDDAVAAYNLGQGGARSWVRAGRPATYQRRVAGSVRTVYVRRYIDSVLLAAAQG